VSIDLDKKRSSKHKVEIFRFRNNVDCFGLIQLLLIAIERILIRFVAIIFLIICIWNFCLFNSYNTMWKMTIYPYKRRYFESDRFLSMKISRNFESFLVSYILSFSEIKYKHLFYKLESIFMNFYRFWITLNRWNSGRGLQISPFVRDKIPFFTWYCKS